MISYELMVLLALAVVLVLIVLAVRGGGPRITTIEHRRDEDDGKDGDHA